MSCFLHTYTRKNSASLQNSSIVSSVTYMLLFILYNTFMGSSMSQWRWSWYKTLRYFFQGRLYAWYNYFKHILRARNYANTYTTHYCSTYGPGLTSSLFWLIIDSYLIFDNILIKFYNQKLSLNRIMTTVLKFLSTTAALWSVLEWNLTGLTLVYPMFSEISTNIE